ncbi:MAG: hypothetical protein A2107_01270 [Verrucomicrobia bacterium GWF2_62_7]|nr:MAG: hypothetical protein A2107_01270 [Verrucomicrobia bacterium GWF2_62_7]
MREVRRAGDRVARERVVVRAVVVVAPIIHAGRNRLHQLLAAEPRHRSRAQDAKCLGFRHCGGLADSHQRVGDVVGKMQLRDRSALNQNARPAKPRRVRPPPRPLRHAGVRQLDIDEQFGLLRQLDGQFALRVAEHHADAASDADIGKFFRWRGGG